MNACEEIKQQMIQDAAKAGIVLRMTRHANENYPYFVVARISTSPMGGKTKSEFIIEASAYPSEYHALLAAAAFEAAIGKTASLLVSKQHVESGLTTFKARMTFNYLS